MSPRIILIALVILFGSLSCGEGPTTLACRDFVEDFDALECTDPIGIDCLQFESDPCIEPEYFVCLSGQYRCELGDLIDEGPSSCLEFRQCP